MSGHEDQLIGEFPFMPKQERAQKKRNALLESGYTLFKVKGYQHTTAKEIASNAGVAVGTFYRYFSDKRQLLMSLLEDQIDQLMPPEPNWIINNPETVLASRLEAYDKRIHELGLRRVLTELLPKDIEFAEVMTAARNKIFSRILIGLEQADEKGLIWKDLDMKTVTWSIMVILEKVPEHVDEWGKYPDYQAIAKVICRMVFPPEVLNE